MKNIFTILLISIIIFSCKKAAVNSGKGVIYVSGYAQQGSINVDIRVALSDKNQNAVYLKDSVVVIVSAPFDTGNKLDTITIEPNMNFAYGALPNTGILTTQACTIISAKSNGYTFTY